MSSNVIIPTTLPSSICDSLDHNSMTRLSSGRISVADTVNQNQMQEQGGSRGERDKTVVVSCSLKWRLWFPWLQIDNTSFFWENLQHWRCWSKSDARARRAKVGKRKHSLTRVISLFCVFCFPVSSFLSQYIKTRIKRAGPDVRAWYHQYFVSVKPQKLKQFLRISSMQWPPHGSHKKSAEGVSLTRFEGQGGEKPQTNGKEKEGGGTVVQRQLPSHDDSCSRRWFSLSQRTQQRQIVNLLKQRRSQGTPQHLFWRIICTKISTWL